jgi:hypothetical protein
MKKLAMSALFVMLLLGSAVAHNGALSLYTDATISVCDGDIGSFENDTIRLYYVRGSGPDLGYGAEFRLEASLLEDALFLGAEWNSQVIATLGDVQTGISLASSQCMGANESVVYVGSIFMMYTGFTNEMFTVMVKENPGSEPPGIYILECEPTLPKTAVLGGTFIFNCPNSPEHCCSPGVKDASWGAIKQLYR